MVAIILVSGLSRRMGENKLIMDVKGEPLIEHTLKKVVSIGFKEIILVYKDIEVKELGDKYGVKTVLNKKYNLGQSESIKIGVENIKVDYEGIMFFTGDQPLLKIETIKEIIKYFKNVGGIVIPKVLGKRKTPTIFSSKFKEDLLKINGDIGGRAVIKNNEDSASFIEFDDSLEFFDIDTKEDCLAVIKLIDGK